MATTFKDARKLQGERVRMYFDDGNEVVALLLCATKDIDGAKHLIYDKVEAGAKTESTAQGSTGCFYADAKTLVRIEYADGKRNPSNPVGHDHRLRADSAAPRAWRANA